MLSTTMLGYSRLIGATVDQTAAVIKELTDPPLKVCDAVTDSNGNITLTNRRMFQAELERQKIKDRVSSFREKREGNEKETSYSSPSPSSSSSEPRIFMRPTAQEVTVYGQSIGFQIDGQRFVDYYDSKGWLIGKTPMKSWKAAVRTWKHNGYGNGGSNGNGNHFAGHAAPTGGPRIID
jgi:RNA-splicing ligase RtcB